MKNEPPHAAFADAPTGIKGIIGKTAQVISEIERIK
jgi:hypothetical protein